MEETRSDGSERAADDAVTSEAAGRRDGPIQENDWLPFGRLLAVLAGCVVLVLGTGLWAELEVRRPAGEGSPLPEATPRVGPERIGRVYQSLIPTRSTADRLHAATERLEHYGWVDQSRDLVRIPIARAIELRAAREDGAS